MKDNDNTEKRHGIAVENLDPSVDPKDNFYMYACGGWKKLHPLKGEYSRFGTFDLLRENARRQLRELITGLANDPDASRKGTNAQKISDIYALGMDMERRNREGAAPIRPLIEKVENAGKDDFTDLLAWFAKGVGGVFFGTGVGADAMDSDRNAMHIGEVGLGLGDRDYYLEKNEHNDKLLAAYQVYVKRIAELAGYDAESQQRMWETIIYMETEFARNKMTREERRDPLNRYNPMNITELREKYPAIEWDRYFKGVGIEELDRVIVISPKMLGFMNDFIPTLTERQWKDYMIIDIISGSTGVLSEDFEKASFEMFEHVMSGTEEQEPLWKRVMRIPNAMFGEVVGQLYVAKYFPEENKEHMMRLVENLRSALGKHISALPWMSDATKEKALEKLASFKVKIGYPDKWKDYSGIEVDPSRSYQENILKASEWFVSDNYADLKKPVDKDEWHMTPQTVNAYYNPTSNEICFPAAILQAPYFDITADDAQNYGGIGVVIGHEMTHGFDDSGRKFDKNGNLGDWWTPEDAEKFNAAADRLVEQFDEVEVAQGVHCNGRYTLGENIADQGGLRVALTAYLDSTADRPEIDGFSALQRFYLSYAGVWADNIREEEVLDRTKSDPHSLGVNRVNVTLRNLDTFFEAFDISEGDAMFRPESERVVIW